MRKKYEFTGKTMVITGLVLKQIKYLFDGRYFSEGQVGGWIESEHNLSHEGECAVLFQAKVFDNARVMDDAIVGSFSVVQDNAQIRGDSYVSNEAIVGADTIIDDTANVLGESKVFFYHDVNAIKANLLGKTRLDGKTIIEATGSIKDCQIKDKKLSGYLNLENEEIY